MKVIDIEDGAPSATAGDNGSSPELRSVYERLRADIIEGRLEANSRLKVHVLAERYGVSTNPVREALQQLRGERFVVITPNSGARVRPIDEEFFRDTYEIEMLIEPFLTHWFVGVATRVDIVELESIQAEIEALNFDSLEAHSRLDTRFHRLMYERHHNSHMLDLWWKHRDIMGAVVRRYDISLNRRATVLREHRELIERIKAHDASGAAAVVAAHVEGSGKAWIEQMRLARR